MRLNKHNKMVDSAEVVSLDYVNTLVKSEETSELSDFCIRMHPKACKTSWDNNCIVDFPNQSKKMVYQIFTTGIVSLDIQSDNRIFYPFI